MAVEVVKIVAYYAENMPFDGLFAVHFVAQQLELEEEMLLVFQSARGLLDFYVVGRQVDLVIGIASRNELFLFNEGFRQRFGDVLKHLLENEFLHLGDGACAKAVVLHLLSGVVDALQSLTDERVLGIILLYLGMDEIVVVVELAGLAEKHVLHAGLESVL